METECMVESRRRRRGSVPDWEEKRGGNPPWLSQQFTLISRALPLKLFISGISLYGREKTHTHADLHMQIRCAHTDAYLHSKSKHKGKPTLTYSDASSHKSPTLILLKTLSNYISHYVRCFLYDRISVIRGVLYLVNGDTFLAVSGQTRAKRRRSSRSWAEGI